MRFIRESTGSWLLARSASHLNANNIPFEDQLPIHDALRMAENAPMAIPHPLRQNEQSLPRHNLPAKTPVVRGPEADEARPLDEFLGVKRRQLCRGLNHQHAGEERPPRDVARDPELVGANVLVA